jgi:hypothetical protein
MIETHYLSKRAHARVLIDKFGASFTAEEIANMNKAIAEADQYRASQGRELTDIKWEQVAERHCPELYQLFYRDLSSDGAHATINALERFLVVDGGGQITDFKAAPDGSGLIEVLSAACLVFLWSAGPYAETNGLSDAGTALSERWQAFATLPGAFPRAAGVTS